MRTVRKIIKYILICIIIVVVGSSSYLIYSGYSMYKDVVQVVSVEDKVAEIRSKKQYTPVDELPQIYKDAIISVEDHRFYFHPGIDILATARAALHDIQAMSLVEGGSTITQQLAKNLYFTQEKKFVRKVAEVFVAIEMERKYTKDEILELYVNSIYFGNNCYCVKDASLTYFGKLPKDMTNYESTLLAGIPNAPSVYSLDVNPTLAKQRQRQVIQKMIEFGYLTQKEANLIIQ
ncbi:transglycosylase domain-containing protein [Faecalimonas sp.]